MSKTSRIVRAAPTNTSFRAAPAARQNFFAYDGGSVALRSTPTKVKMTQAFSIIEVNTPSEFKSAELLIREYVQWLNFDLSFQQFDAEMAALAAVYCPPHGRLFLALMDDRPMGVAGIKKFSGEACEVKRMFVRPRRVAWGWVSCCCRPVWTPRKHYTTSASNWTVPVLCRQP